MRPRSPRRTRRGREGQDGLHQGTEPRRHREDKEIATWLADRASLCGSVSLWRFLSSRVFASFADTFGGLDSLPAAHRIQPDTAAVAELADALDSGSSVQKTCRFNS